MEKRIEEFSVKTIEKLQHYVYALLDPEDDKIFYIGEGQGNRVFDHAKGDIEGNEHNEKLKTINEINKNGKSVKYYIIAHGIKKKNIENAFQIEAILIEFLKYYKLEKIAKLTNIQSGHNFIENGVKSVEKIEALYGAELISRNDLIKLGHKIVIINVNKTFGDGRSLYDATRKSWKMDNRRINKIEYVLAEYKGIIRAVFKPLAWLEEGKRKYFEGEEVTDKEILGCYLNRMIEKKKGAQNPLRYFNC